MLAGIAWVYHVGSFTLVTSDTQTRYLSAPFFTFQAERNSLKKKKKNYILPKDSSAPRFILAFTGNVTALQKWAALYLIVKLVLEPVKRSSCLGEQHIAPYRQICVITDDGAADIYKKTDLGRVGVYFLVKVRVELGQDCMNWSWGLFHFSNKWHSDTMVSLAAPFSTGFVTRALGSHNQTRFQSWTKFYADPVSHLVIFQSLTKTLASI